jgi:hypothetical protein
MDEWMDGLDWYRFTFPMRSIMALAFTGRTIDVSALPAGLVASQR